MVRNNAERKLRIREDVTGLHHSDERLVPANGTD